MSILLDTCAIFYVAEDRYIGKLSRTAVYEAASHDALWVSLASAWEIGKLASQGRTAIAKNPLAFFKFFLTQTGAQICELNADMMINSSFLPGRIHGDPMDRLLIESARHLNLTLLTSDRAILAYGAEGHVKTLAC